MNIHEDDFSFKVTRETLNFNKTCLKPEEILGGFLHRKQGK
jgi:hypothetical protein